MSTTPTFAPRLRMRRLIGAFLSTLIAVTLFAA